MSSASLHRSSTAPTDVDYSKTFPHADFSAGWVGFRRALFKQAAPPLYGRFPT